MERERGNYLFSTCKGTFRHPMTSRSVEDPEQGGDSHVSILYISRCLLPIICFCSSSFGLSSYDLILNQPSLSFAIIASVFSLNQVGVVHQRTQIVTLHSDKKRSP
ncbi:Uncharacterised protein at_DN1072 [Pycnogonum litorale]